LLEKVIIRLVGTLTISKSRFSVTGAVTSLGKLTLRKLLLTLSGVRLLCSNAAKSVFVALVFQLVLDGALLALSFDLSISPLQATKSETGNAMSKNASVILKVVIFIVALRICCLT